LAVADGAATGKEGDRKGTTRSERHFFWVVQSGDKKHGSDRVIVTERDLLGLEVTSGPATKRRADVGGDGEITYVAKWVDDNLFPLESQIRPRSKDAKAAGTGSYLQTYLRREQRGGRGTGGWRLRCFRWTVEALKK